MKGLYVFANSTNAIKLVITRFEEKYQRSVTIYDLLIGTRNYIVCNRAYCKVVETELKKQAGGVHSLQYV